MAMQTRALLPLALLLVAGGSVGCGGWERPPIPPWDPNAGKGPEGATEEDLMEMFDMEGDNASSGEATAAPPPPPPPEPSAEAVELKGMNGLWMGVEFPASLDVEAKDGWLGGRQIAKVTVMNKGAKDFSESGAAHIKFTVKMAGNDVQCLKSQGKTPQKGPASMAAGGSHTFDAPLSCDLSKAGVYSVTPHISFEGDKADKYVPGKAFSVEIKAK